MVLKDFYHYTGEDAIDAILDSGYIRESEDGGPDAHFGKGVYGTSLPPSAGKKKIAWNNWKQGWKQREKTGRVDYVLHLRIPERNLKEFKGSGRQVYLHRGPIRLDEYDWDVLQV